MGVCSFRLKGLKKQLKCVCVCVCVCVLIGSCVFGQFVQSQRVKKSRLKQTQRYHEVKLLKHTFVAWKVRQHFVIT